MTDPNMKADAVIVAAAAKRVSVRATIEINTKISKGFIWLLKLKYIWSIVRADVKKEYKES